ncbi:DUF5694 domain-containing protein [Microbulbifer variabilis]|uniref:DUF5694 domain-containing protein n=2 Tax=Microbulbifer TaxID=48073 RepID=UPI00248061D0|nr:DUF5694 domain-containing protein [Microbulbifer variabilis]
MSYNRKAGLKSVICYDERNVHWKGAELREYMAKETPEERKFMKTKKKLSKETSQRNKSLSLGQLLEFHNNPIEDRDNMNLYIMGNDIGVGQEFIDADAATSSWHHNFRMYANIQVQANRELK